jgi:hypothetical protein
MTTPYRTPAPPPAPARPPWWRRLLCAVGLHAPWASQIFWGTVPDYTTPRWCADCGAWWTTLPWHCRATTSLVPPLRTCEHTALHGTWRFGDDGMRLVCIDCERAIPHDGDRALT